MFSICRSRLLVDYLLHRTSRNFCTSNVKNVFLQSPRRNFLFSFMFTNNLKCKHTKHITIRVSSRLPIVSPFRHVHMASVRSRAATFIFWNILRKEQVPLYLLRCRWYILDTLEKCPPFQVGPQRPKALSNKYPLKPGASMPKTTRD